MRPLLRHYVRHLLFHFASNSNAAQTGFEARENGYALYLNDSDVTLSLRGNHHPSVLRLRFTGANSHPKTNALELQSSYSSYFVGNDPRRWRVRVPNYAKIRYSEVYPRIDLVYSGADGDLEYDWIVKPGGADVSTIRLDVDGASGMRIDNKSGDLIFQTPAGEVRQRKPVFYQEIWGARTHVEGRFVKRGERTIGFKAAHYDSSRPLVIDPILSYSTYYNDGFETYGTAVATDSHGNAYITGTTSGVNGPDAFVTKIGPGGSVVYTTSLAGTDYDTGSGIALDSVGNVYVAGYTESTDFPVVNALQPSYAGTKESYTDDAFVSKISADGTVLIYSTYLGGSAEDRAYGITVDSAGTAYITGVTASSNLPTTRNAFQGTLLGSQVAFIAKIVPNGSGFVYSTYLGGAGITSAWGIAADSAGDDTSPDSLTHRHFQP